MARSGHGHEGRAGGGPVRVSLVSAYPPQADGIGAHAEQLVRAMGERAAVRVLTRRDPTGPPDGPAPVDRVLSARPACIAAARRALVGARPQVIHVQFNIPSLGGAWCWAAVAAGLARRRLGSRILVTLHEVRRDIELLGPVGRLLLAAIGRWSDALIVYTSEARDLLVERCGVAPGKVTVMAHGAPSVLPGATAGQDDPGADGATAPIVSFGYLHPDKGIEHLLDAVAELRRRNPAALGDRRVLVAGGVRGRRGLFRLFEHRDRAYARGLRQRAHVLGLDDVVRFCGHVPTSSVAPLLAGAAVAVLPYTNATQSGVLNLLLAARVPIVASELPGLAETLGEAGLLAPAGDHRALARQLERVLVDEALRSRVVEGLAAVHERVAFPAVAEELAALYARLAGEAAGAAPTEVTAVVVNYNQGRFLRGAVASIERQTVPVRSIVVVDDASTDESAVVLDGLPPSVRVLRRATNGGVAAARNDGLAAVATPFVVFLDADDVLLARFVERTTAALAREGDARLAVVYSPARRYYLDPVGLLRRHRGYLLSRCFDPNALARDNFICNTALLRTEAVRGVGGFAAAMDQLGHEDWDLYLSMAEQGWRGRLVPRPLFCYRIVADSRNHASLRRWQEVCDVIAARHPSAAAARKAGEPRRALRHRVVEATQWAWCLLDLASWAREPQRDKRALEGTSGVSV